MRGHRVTWDEAKIREYEESKPVRQKIPEPKTPYNTMIDADNGCVSPLQNFEGFDDNSAHAEALIRALNEVASGQRQFGGWTSSEDEADGDLEQDGDSAEDERGKSSRERRSELSDEERAVEIEGSDESLRTIEIEGGEETGQDVEIL
ncbi:protein phosphatase inhibitor 2-like [Vitis riparia]|uniref:protein phosphatase inhibitor 2-like n=1 Tax=Vitis riparia TaxID=96939 RepID=UPI00155B1A0C|nr:protein phosphatase inhibitor 2-like [Vitis riparia]